MRRKTHKLLQLVRSRRGSTLVLVALLLPAIAGAVALVVDIGHVAENKRQLQNAADSAALAGVQELPDSPDSARAVAIDYANQHGATLLPGDVRIFATHYPNDTIEVTLTRNVSYFFAQAIGFSSQDVHATATAIVGSFAGGNGILPFGVAREDGPHDVCPPGGADFGFSYLTPYRIKLGPGDEHTGGNFCALDIDGGGASTYRATIANGSANDVLVCQWVDTERGNMNQPTCQGLNQRMARDTLTHNTSSIGAILCNYDDSDPYNDTICGHGHILDCPRALIVPIIDEMVRPPGQALVVGFGIFVVLDYQCGSTSYLDGFFVRTMGPEDWTHFGPYTPGPAPKVVKLIQ